MEKNIENEMENCVCAGVDREQVSFVRLAKGSLSVDTGIRLLV